MSVNGIMIIADVVKRIVMVLKSDAFTKEEMLKLKKIIETLQRITEKTLSAGPEGDKKDGKAKEMTPAMIAWLANGRRGTSSNTIFTHITGIDALGIWPPAPPADPDDMTRCRRLLEACPEIAREFHRMSTASDVWARLVDTWDSLCALMDEEAPDWREGGSWDCPKTYEQMKGIGC